MYTQQNWQWFGHNENQPWAVGWVPGGGGLGGGTLSPDCPEPAAAQQLTACDKTTNTDMQKLPNKCQHKVQQLDGILQQSVTWAVVWLPWAGCCDLRGAGLGGGTSSPAPEDCWAPAAAKDMTPCNHAINNTTRHKKQMKKQTITKQMPTKTLQPKWTHRLLLWMTCAVRKLLINTSCSRCTVLANCKLIIVKITKQL